MAPRKRTKRRGGGAQRPVLRYEFSYIMNMGVQGGDRLVTYSDLGVDSSRPCRPLRVSVNMCCTNGSGACMSVGIYGPRVSEGESTRSVVSRSRTMAVGATARTITVSIPRATDFSSPAGNDYVFNISAQCSQPGTGSVTHVMVTGEVSVQFESRSHPVLLK